MTLAAASLGIVGLLGDDAIEHVHELQLRRHIAALDDLLASEGDDVALRRALAAAVPDASLVLPETTTLGPVATVETPA